MEKRRRQRSADPYLSMEISRAPGATLPTISGRLIDLATERHVSSFVSSFNNAETHLYTSPSNLSKQAWPAPLEEILIPLIIGPPRDPPNYQGTCPNFLFYSTYYMHTFRLVSKPWPHCWCELIGFIWALRPSASRKDPGNSEKIEYNASLSLSCHRSYYSDRDFEMFVDREAVEIVEDGIILTKDRLIQFVKIS